MALSIDAPSTQCSPRMMVKLLLIYVLGGSKQAADVKGGKKECEGRRMNDRAGVKSGVRGSKRVKLEQCMKNGMGRGARGRGCDRIQDV